MSTANIIGNAIFGLRNKSGGNYIDPAVKESLVGLWKFDQNTNESPTRNIIKNTIKDKGGDLELLNFAYKANSGYNGYPEDFTTYTYNAGNVIVKHDELSFNGNANTPTPIIYKFLNGNDSDLKEYTINFTKIGDANVTYRYIDIDGNLQELELIEGKNKLPYSHVSKLPIDNTTIWIGYKISKGNGCTITQLPLYEGALVTDGKDDMIVSQKTVQEMGITNEITVVSMIHQINAHNSAANASYTNYIRGNIGFVRNTVTNADKTGIYGYTWNNSTKSTINNILGDKNDYRIETGNSVSLEEKFSVEGYINNGSPTECSEVAIYWTFISNKVLTTDEINQIIGYFKLDKYVTPQVIYAVKKQGLSNDTPEADWYLKDFSGNGHDMTLYNFAKKLGSGIGKYEVDFNTWTPQSYVADSAYTSNKLHITNIKGGNAILYTKKGANAMKVKITGIQSFNLVYRYIAENDVWEALEVDRDGIYELPASTTTTKTYYTGFTVPYYTGDCDITIEQIPDYEGALVSDGIDDYGKVENLPIYKDYTVAIDRAWTNDLVKAQCLTSKLNGNNFGSFSFELIENGFSSYSFGISNKGVITIDSNKKINYQSKYVYNGSPIISGNNVDGKDLFLFRNRDSYPYYAEAAIWSYILFPYTLSEFLLERQLKRYKLGTLYPGMIEWRPIFNSNVDIDKYYVVNKTTNKQLSIGDYFAITDTIELQVYLTDKEGQEITSLTINGKSFTPTFIDVRYLYNIENFGEVTGKKSPQKINITIDEYIRYEDIVQPYPAIINLKQDGKTITWGDKLKVGSDIVFVESANLLPELYTVSDTRYNGVTLYPNTIIKVEKSMVFDNARTYLKANEPSCILSPNRLRIPNSSYKILGYIPDLTGKGNHGRLNNFAYTEESGANEDGSIKFDGTDDHITIPTLAHGGKCVMMKVNWSNNGMLYDQRLNSSVYTFGILTGEATLAYNARNNGSTYIDGILNANIIPSDLVGITHNITAVNDAAIDNNTVSPRLGVSVSNATFSNQALYEFMLFPEIPSEDEIKKLNNVMGIEGGYVESPDYYWDMYGKNNNNAFDIEGNKYFIPNQVQKQNGISPTNAEALAPNNFAFNEESGYVDNGLVSDGVDDNLKNTNMPVLTDYTWIMKRKRLNDKSNTTLCHKGNGITQSAFLFEYIEGAIKAIRSFGATTSNITFPNLISWQTKNSYNGQTIASGTSIDGNALHVFMGSNVYPYYTKAVFYKAMLYSKTIDQLSINMLKNLFEKDELIDITNPIFKKQ